MSMNFSDLFGGGGVKPWVSGATYAAGKVAMSPADNYQLYVRVVAGAGTTDPSADTTNWKPFGARARKSIQRGKLTLGAGQTAASATILGVVPSKTSVRMLGFATSDSGTPDYYMPLIELANATTLTATRTRASATTTTISYEVEEFY